MSEYSLKLSQFWVASFRTVEPEFEVVVVYTDGLVWLLCCFKNLLVILLGYGLITTI